MRMSPTIILQLRAIAKAIASGNTHADMALYLNGLAVTLELDLPTVLED